jgi:hypothetical protein
MAARAQSGPSRCSSASSMAAMTALSINPEHAPSGAALYARSRASGATPPSKVLYGLHWWVPPTAIEATAVPCPKQSVGSSSPSAVSRPRDDLLIGNGGPAEGGMERVHAGVDDRHRGAVTGDAGSPQFVGADDVQALGGRDRPHVVALDRDHVRILEQRREPVGGEDGGEGRGQIERPQPLQHTPALQRAGPVEACGGGPPHRCPALFGIEALRDRRPEGDDDRRRAVVESPCHVGEDPVIAPVSRCGGGGESGRAQQGGEDDGEGRAVYQR